MADRPSAVICMTREAAEAVLPEQLRDRLSETVDLAPDIEPEALTGLSGADGGACAAARSGSPGGAAATALADAEILITGWGCPPLTEEVLDAAPRLRAVIHAAGSVKGHITPAVWQHGITVSSAADANAGPVAEFTYAAIVLAAKQALQGAAQYADGWPHFAEREGTDGRTVGIVGASRTGRRVIARLTASDADYRVLLADPYVTEQQAAALGTELAPLDDLCHRSSILSLHAPELPETRHLLDARRLALLPDGATVVNTARGALIDTDALTRECAAGRLNAYLDVTWPEPLAADHRLLSLRNALITPHVAGAQGNEVRRLGAYAVAETERFVRGEPLEGLVTAADLDRIA
ncbi:hydroxyacid dehydrogenase [Streptomyces sp. 8N616]|uniref:hydroxyacid dehydrogenase n=1 Tax=Streptomyces sp. 8N616 TaxID=3457414 RepID=UPI003FD50D03